LLGFVIRRLLSAAVVLLLVAVIDYTMLGHRLGGVFFHFDFGIACSYPGCPPVRALWARSWIPDVALLAGALIIAVPTGVGAAIFCATHPRSVATRTVETLGLLFYSMPAYLFGFGLLLLFEPSFGAFHMPWFFHPGDYENPGDDLWKFVEAMLVPCLIVAAPFAAVVMRLVQAEAVDELETDYVRTAEAKGVRRRVVIRRHAVRPAYGTVASVVGVWVPSLITNMVLVEFVFFVPGFFGQLHSALAPGKLADVPLVQGLALWGAVLIVAVSVLADLVLVTLDPRVR
jgi:peptide/nickel transport system permease protein